MTLPRDTGSEPRTPTTQAGRLLWHDPDFTVMDGLAAILAIEVEAAHTADDRLREALGNALMNFGYDIPYDRGDKIAAAVLEALALPDRAEPVCEWCGETVRWEFGVLTNDNSGDYCSEGRAVGPTGTSPHRLADRAEPVAPVGLDVERLAAAMRKASEYVSEGGHGRGPRLMHRNVTISADSVATEYARLAEAPDGR